MMLFLKDFFEFIKERKKFVLLPLILVILLIGGLAILAGSGSAIAPFIYTLF